ncbi:Zn-ribbon domain-containing OB-fold protein [Siccirubricoccus sp. KC 17139]|uniref:Zn-ribbon domain-containing OB-fold protein n=1 Tax=Siccirubricoccus soli TaxID=2899147 RepID=A0ABT1CZL9_9PROT|nr:Zn-ribbon domain-containing OB-fold protein [Siccirubricoccus soli]MCO6415102.1 Zn-ribbon domain-containing OB-fold protein [Siccirubricoccus soli]MCP2681233.1 Zn-ribbon domain-containing OB-fold protein [Siccirubricoccus soli]
MSQTMPGKPMPDPSPETRPYWDGLAEGRLMLQRCAECGRIRHYPQPMCPSCHSMAADWVEASGEATVHSWTVAHHPFHAAFRAELPYVLVTADLPEGVRLLAQLRDATAEALRPGRKLRIGFEANEAGLTLPVLRLAGA